MNAAEAPVFGDPDWNQNRARVAAALTDVEADMQPRGYGLNNEGLTLEVAGRLLYLSRPAKPILDAI